MLHVFRSREKRPESLLLDGDHRIRIVTVHALRDSLNLAEPLLDSSLIGLEQAILLVADHRANESLSGREKSVAHFDDASGSNSSPRTGSSVVRFGRAFGRDYFLNTSTSGCRHADAWGLRLLAIWPASPWRRAFWEDFRLPSSVRGPVECCALAQFASN